MMNVLVSKSATIMNEFIDNQLMPLMEKIKKPKGWSYSPKTESTEASQKYCGINNLGAICYMNSMMQ
jgi:ubiquitin carboxyl-terminal hydrolase 9/24